MLDEYGGDNNSFYFSVSIHVLTTKPMKHQDIFDLSATFGRTEILK